MPKTFAQKPTDSANHFFKDWALYLKTSIFGLIVFALSYSYTKSMNIPGELNKSMADTSIILIGLSMLLSSVCYFWNIFDWAIIYRKYLGLIGFAFGVAHMFLSWGAFLSLLNISTWQQGKMWPAFMGALALLIFTLMVAVSNTFSIRHLGVTLWKRILGIGYLAVIFVWLHVVLLKSGRWITWYQGGMKTLPSLSLIVTIFMTIVLFMRLMLAISLRRKKAKVK